MKFIEHREKIKVRFSETDAMGVIWHGNYLKYFEDGRERLGEVFGFTYFDCYSNGFVVPLVKMELNYKAPLFFGDEIEIITRLIHTKVAKIKYEYEIFSLTTNKLCCTGSSEQVFLKEDTRTLELFAPEFYTHWYTQLNWIED